MPDGPTECAALSYLRGGEPGRDAGGRLPVSYDCKGCGQRLKPKPGDCCVFCSYGSVPCPPIQENGKSACCC